MTWEWGASARHLVDDKGEIVASVTRGFNCWLYAGRKFVSDSAACRAAEAHLRGTCDITTMGEAV
jgi:hypothetical protein